MGVLTDLKNEIEQLEGERELPPNAQMIMQIAKGVDELNLKIPRELIFKAAVQACFENVKLS